MLIAIPSKARVTKQVTLANLPLELRRLVYLVVEADEAQAYSFLNQPLIIMKEGQRGTGAARQAAVDFAQDKGIKKILMLDDDLTFAHRRIDDDPTKFRAATDTAVLDCITDVEKQLDNYAHVSIAAREGGNRRTEAYVDNIRALRALAFRVDILQTTGIRFDVAQVMEDFHVQLSLLLEGYAHRTVNWIVQNQGSSNAAGGCSTYRTMEVQHLAATSLALRFPDFVRVVQKTTKTAWGGQTRSDVIISWKAAYERGIKKFRLRGC